MPMARYAHEGACALRLRQSPAVGKPYQERAYSHGTSGTRVWNHTTSFSYMDSATPN
jgi:hypothetical protein